jgi:hypothetical protein
MKYSRRLIIKLWEHILDVFEINPMNKNIEI